jgi:anaerobic selenocysteine-containing dehydrogenase
MATAPLSDPDLANHGDVATYCVLCNHNCGIRVDVEEGRIAKVRKDPSNPFSRGHMCNKAASIPFMENHAQRVRHPLRRTRDGGFERVTWDQAIADIAARLNAILAEHGGRALAACGLGGQGSHLGGHRMLSLLDYYGSQRWFCAYAQEKTQHHLLEEWMFDAPPTMFFSADADNSDYLIAMGTNPRASNLIRNHTAYLQERKRRGDQKLVVVDPRVSDFARDADHHVALRPGTDAYFLLAMTAVLVREKWVDETWLAEHSHGFAALERELAGIDVGELARRCDVPLADIERITREYAHAERASVEHGLGAEHVWFSTFVSYLSHLLPSLTGNAGRKGGNVFFPSLTPPVRNPGRFEEPPRAVASGIRGIQALVPSHMFSPTLAPEEVLVDHPDRIRAMFLDTSNPLLSYSDAGRWREAFEALELLVVVDPAMTESAQYADYVLPAASPYQKWGYADFPKRWPEMIFQLRRPVTPIEAGDESLSEPEIYARLVRAMGVFGVVPRELMELGAEALTPVGAARFFFRSQELAALFDDARPGARLAHWIQEAIGPHLPAHDITPVYSFCIINALMRPEVLKRSLGAAWRDESDPFALALEVFERILAHPQGVEVGRFDPDETWQGQLGWEDGKIRLLPEPMIEELRRVVATDLTASDPDHPFIVATGVRTRWTANTIQRDPRWRKGKGPHCALHLARVDAEALGVAEGDPVRVTSNRASLVAPAAIDDGLRPGNAWLPNGFGMRDAEGEPVGVNGNELTDTNDRDPFTGCPHHKGVRCRLEAC